MKLKCNDNSLLFASFAGISIYQIDTSTTIALCKYFSNTMSSFFSPYKLQIHHKYTQVIGISW